ncbi:alpha-L-fucosidase [Luteolibacter flavescens]|uniref:alpha-L-fucosidase n=1 Tax=Luteolibacter flavescens TaxID=1859460 RepID=A0ABT3FKI7_9BACT|nr:alpha-L-fucosidase [Luteolibacter flavescens]MCW1884096.1 alpha-L-fucosidase [Luteolibacter flavescens]
MSRPRFLPFIPAALLLLGLSTTETRAEVVIDSTHGNGGFVSSTLEFNGSPDGWMAQRGVWIGNGNSYLETAPFGIDDAEDSRFVMLHHDEGDHLTSTREFSLQAGESVALDFDWSVWGEGSDTVLTVQLWDTIADQAFATLGTFSTADGSSGYEQESLTFTAAQARARLALRFTISAAAGGLGKDFFIDRIHLTGGTVVPPGATAIIHAGAGNGGFVNGQVNLNGSPQGWVAEHGVWIGSGSSHLTTSPFGADTANDSRIVTLHRDGGDTLTSATGVAVRAGEEISVSFDRAVFGSGSPTTLSVQLWDEVAREVFTTLGTFASETTPGSWLQTNLTFTAPESRQRLVLRFAISAATGGQDFTIDRVHLAGGSVAAPLEIQYDFVHKILPGDDEATRIEKAAKTLPRPKQVEWQRMETTYFIHFGPNTFNGVEWGTGHESPDDFQPTAFDATQWVDVIKQAGGKMLILVVKHHDGFCLYPSRYTNHDLASASWLGGQGDIVRAVSEACADAGIALGIYLSPADLYQIEGGTTNYETGVGYYGNNSAAVASHIPTNPATFGSNPALTRPAAPGAGEHVYTVDDYNRYFLNQLYELLTEYGPIAEIWFDGANPHTGSSQTYNYPAWFDLIYKLQPDINIAVGGSDVRWVGNEIGIARETEWSVTPFSADPQLGGGQPNPFTVDIGSRSKIVPGSYTYWFPAEADVPILGGWFWHPNHPIRSTATLTDIYFKSVGRNANLLLNLSPDKRGLIPDNQIAPLYQAMSSINRTFEVNLADDAVPTASTTSEGQPAALALDGDLDTWWEPATGDAVPTFTLTFPETREFDIFVLQEAIATRSQRIEQFAIDTRTGTGEWVERAVSTTVGHKRIVKLPTAVTGDAVRFRILSSRLSPSLASVGVHLSAAAVSPPEISGRQPDGSVPILGSDGRVVRYTVDGSEPSATSPLYSSPVPLPLGGTIKAVAYEDGQPSYTVSRFFSGVVPTGWQVLSTDAEELPSGAAALAIDDHTDTSWLTPATGGATSHPHHLAIDMGAPRWIGGFGYHPADSGVGVVWDYRFETSTDGVHWTEASAGRFDNMVNNPNLRMVTLPQAVKVRYFRFTSLSDIAGSGRAGASEVTILPAGFEAYLREAGLQHLTATDDPNSDGRPLLMDYYFGSDPFGPATVNPVRIQREEGGIVLEALRRTGATALSAVLQSSTDLEEWEDLGTTLPASTDLGNGVTRDRYTLPQEGSKRFFRLHVKQ